jgi:predicted transcriptional regulator of viral defense system
MSQRHDFHRDAVSAFVNARSVVRARDLLEAGLDECDIRRWLHRKWLVRLERGVYGVTTSCVSDHHLLVAAAVRVPKGVVALKSALSLHGLLAGAPAEVWLALPPKTWRPLTKDVPIRYVYFSKAAATAGVEEHLIEGVRVRTFGAAKSVADVLKHRKVIGVEVAERALREFLRTRPGELEELRKYAVICRVQGVLRDMLHAS